jgi:hypothetical protein
MDMYMDMGKCVYRTLVWKSHGKKLLGRPRHRWQDNISIYFTEVMCEDN